MIVFVSLLPTVGEAIERQEIKHVVFPGDRRWEQSTYRRSGGKIQLS
ncbi:MAG UNVERIFIED_CONTAM: hypothetical protein LVR29_27720 [Microcystis novacekii LVE1205-3]